jgi:tRNA U34 5-methylaminomethyl-2-thiouridine-forming methyltransferase MnmC
LKREVIITADGSSSIHIPEWNEQYHSKHGAIQEAQHVFIKMGFQYILQQQKLKELNILEIGFGTGLNAIITLLEAEKNELPVNYTGVEAYPVTPGDIQQLNYATQLNGEQTESYFQKIHAGDWEVAFQVSSNFTLTKEQKFFDEISAKEKFQLIYFDAFGARVQPELWEQPIFQKMYNALQQNGVLVTYSAKGSARRAMIACGFQVEKIPGPPGKREMLRAVKV